MNYSRSFLVFSSVGDSYHKAIKSWWKTPLKTERSYDLFFVYYGDDIDRFTWLAARCDRIYWGKGSKFQNFIKLYQTLGLSRYEYIWLVDDDIKLDVDNVNLLFHLTSQYGLAVSQPSLSRYGTISYPIQIPEIRNCILRYTNFIEVTCPVLSRDAASRLVSIIEPLSDKLTCHGIDIIMSHYIHGPKRRFAIIDSIMTRNPYAIEKRDGSREIFRVADAHILRKNWEDVRKFLPAPRPPVEPEIFEYEAVFSVSNSVMAAAIRLGCESWDLSNSL